MTGSTGSRAHPVAEMFTRPNGKTYRPRKPGLRASAWDNQDNSDDSDGVIIFGTLDPAAALPFAREMCSHWFGVDDAVDPRPGWYRQGYQNGQPWWIDDPERGRPGVMFTAAELRDRPRSSTPEGETTDDR